MSRLKGSRRTDYSEEEIRILKELYPNTRNLQISIKLGRSQHSVEGKAWLLGLKKSHEFWVKQNQENIGGKIHRFPKGHVPFNKGKTGGPSCSPETTFKKGNLPPNTKYDGCIRIHKEKYRNGKAVNYLWIRISKAKWKMLHVFIWELANGPVPKSHIIVFRDRNTMNIALYNLECISKAENATRNRWGIKDPELISVISLISKLNKKIREHKRKQNHIGCIENAPFRRRRTSHQHV